MSNRARPRRLINYAACAWSILFAAPHVWWAMGISVGFPGGADSYRLFMGSRWRYVYDVVVVFLSGAAAIIAFGLTRTRSMGLPRWALRSAAWIASAVLSLRGAAGLVVDGGSDLVWWPTFLTGGVLFAGVAWLARRGPALEIPADDEGFEEGKCEE